MQYRLPQFIYFDLGNVLVRFDQDRASRQMAAVAGTTASTVEQVVFQSGLSRQYERGEISTDEFFRQFCDRTGTRPDRRQLLEAASDIFELNVPVVPIAAHLSAAGYRLGILSNTCPVHWEFLSNGRFPVLWELFPVRALSFELRTAKPDPEIYRRAAELAGTAPEAIFFMDDHQANVTAARQAGFDAVLFTTPDELASHLRHRGVRFNY